MISVLKKIKEERTLAEFHPKRDDDGKFNVGFCLDYDDEYYLVESISPKGRWDGYACYLVDEIDAIAVDTIYLNNIKKLMQHKRSYHREFPITDKTVLAEMFDYIMQNKKICTIMTSEGAYISGIITEVLNNVVVIDSMDGDGYKDGVWYIKKDNIVVISVDSEAEVKLEVISNQ